MARSGKTEASSATPDPAEEISAETAPGEGNPATAADSALAEAAEPETRDEARAEPVPFADPVRAVPPPRRRPLFLPLFLGGAAAALAGFVAAVYLSTQYPQARQFLGLPDPAATTTALDDRLAEQDRQLADLAASIAALPPADGAGQAALDAMRTENGAALADLGARIDGIEADIAALRRDLAQVRTAPGTAATAADIAAATEEATKQAQAAAADAARVRTETEAIARHSAVSTALSELDAAVENGSALDGALAKLAGAGVTVPEALSAQAQGVPTLAALRQAFPSAARDALALSLAETAGSAGTWDRISAFLRSQTGARSLTPRAGDDPDAVLSRAEAALNSGDVAAALTELEALPEAGRQRIAEWAGLAQRRVAARAALAALSAEAQ
jgi:hypothetical protein